MREIKFRAWDGTRMWGFGEAPRQERKTPDRYGEKRTIREYDEWWGSDWDIFCSSLVACATYLSLMQYTGIKDKNGREIYEGDIIHEHGDLRFTESDPPATYDSDITVAFGEWDDGSLGWNISPWMSDSYAVIGNIYENTELLTKEET